ncbi:PhzF family phenazine biosynthesis protein [Palleronia sediminis]|uniref:PhzF family phenazine biosynthesis protein n=1 Tax=Palleronia sediminis TaxID=2547833 RepID=A0A4R6A9G2_9RHOB|nr:PhzF family phenazine biosynthesis protein [Palleronia sediminis]TDL79525.1 PhzF family phenazine biosynthesis protein [Palleronia sediminis]
MTGYRVYDVFTDAPFGGNPLAIVPDAAPLPECDLQRIAAEFGFSETVFVYPPDAPGTVARLRIFTPRTEIPFAGHPLIGTAVALCDMGRAAGQFDLSTGAGRIACEVDGAHARFTQTRALELGPEIDAATVAACLGLDASRLAGPPAVASVGLPFVLAPLASLPDLDAAAPVTAAFRAAQDRYRLPLDFAIYAHVRNGPRIEARMFAPLDDIPEDPATGSAAAALGAWIAHSEGGPVEIEISQGVAMGRPSRIGVAAGPSGVTVSGQAVPVMEGRLLTGANDR